MTGTAASKKGDRIRQARRSKGLTQAELATILGVHKDSVSNWETGKHEPDGNTPKLEEALDIDLSRDLADELPPEEITLDAALDRLRDAEREMDRARRIIRQVLDRPQD